MNEPKGAAAVARVVLTGSESTGKTSLAALLAAHYHTRASSEFVREFALSTGGRLDFADHGPIARGQMAAEDDAIAHATDVVFLDTDLLSTVVYCEHYYGRCPEWIVETARQRSGELYLLMNTEVPWAPDSTRNRGDRREEMHGLFKARLQSFALPFVEITGDRDARFAAAVRAVDALLFA